MKLRKNLSRREFIKLMGFTLGGFALSDKRVRKVTNKNQFHLRDAQSTLDFPTNQTLGRVCAGERGAHFSIKSEPYWDAPDVGIVWRDDVIKWKREVIAKQLDPLRINQRWIETDQGYIYAQYVQKTKHIPQEPLLDLPQTSSGDRGMWVEIVTPYTGMTFAKPPAQTWVRETINPRLYYSQVFWAFDVRINPETGKTEYCLEQLYGALPDAYWIDASVCRQITPEEISPIHPDADNKHIIVDLLYQTLSCYEGDEEVFFSKVTTGWRSDDGEWQTPLGTHTIWRKMLSSHMSGTIVGGYDLSGIGWTTLFDNHGAAIHATYWHNEFGIPGSHGCVNAQPEDAKWIWRWTEPAVEYYPGDLIIQGQNKSTSVEVIYD